MASPLPGDGGAWPAANHATAPRRLAPSASGNQPYTVLGRRYHPLPSARGYVKRGIASWYGRKFHGRLTSSGDIYDMFAMTAAHPLLPLPTYARVTNLDNDKSVVVLINDRGPFAHDRLIDLSYRAARELGLIASGTARVEVAALPPPPHEVSEYDDGGGTGGTGGTGGAGAGGTGSAELPTIWLQVGAYSQPANARNMRKRLTHAGYPVAPPAVAADGLHRVRVGPFASDAAAVASQRQLATLLGRAVSIVVAPPRADKAAGT